MGSYAGYGREQLSLKNPSRTDGSSVATDLSSRGLWTHLQRVDADKVKRLFLCASRLWTFLTKPPRTDNKTPGFQKNSPIAKRAIRRTYRILERSKKHNPPFGTAPLSTIGRRQNSDAPSHRRAVPTDGHAGATSPKPSLATLNPMPSSGHPPDLFLLDTAITSPNSSRFGPRSQGQVAASSGGTPASRRDQIFPS